MNPAFDSDYDGLPDAWEIAHGLDPANPLDAALDADGDGLTNLEEVTKGTKEGTRAWAWSKIRKPAPRIELLA